MGLRPMCNHEDDTRHVTNGLSFPSVKLDVKRRGQVSMSLTPQLKILF